MTNKVYAYMVLNLLEYCCTFGFIVLSILLFNKWHVNRKNKYLNFYFVISWMVNIIVQIFGIHIVWSGDAIRRSKIEADITIYKAGQVEEQGTIFSDYQKLAHLMLLTRWLLYGICAVAVVSLGIIYFFVFHVYRKYQQGVLEMEKQKQEKIKNELIKNLEGKVKVYKKIRSEKKLMATPMEIVSF